MADNVCAYCGAPAGRVGFVGVLRVPHCHSAACEAAVESDGDAVVELSLRWSTRTRRRPSAQVAAAVRDALGDDWWAAGTLSGGLL